jgi:hypothetical protein
MGETQEHKMSEPRFGKPRRHPVLRILPGLLVIALACPGSSRIGVGQPANSAAASPGRVEGASDVLSLGT